MDLRGELIRLLGLASFNGDEDILKEVRKLKGMDDNVVATKTAVALHSAAAAFQRRAAEGGIKLDIAQAVQKVQDGTAW
ncbi:MAG: hypothetical protein KJ585_04875 [Alphaproteobacteria bacterium]|nr:hypothetical protein [Alphaproteobacteria bacterium]